jgi:RNA polymerase sporulation-specific sigma factor
VTDAALVLRARGGDELAFRHLLDRHDRLLRGVASPYFLPGGDAADLVQEARIGAFKAIRDFDPMGGASFRNFLSLCASRQVIAAVTAATRGKHRPLNDAVSLQQPMVESDEREHLSLGEALPDGRQFDPAEILSDRDELSIVLAAVLDMTDLERAATAGVGSGHSYAEICEATDREFKTIDNAHQRGQRKIRRALEAA